LAGGNGVSEQAVQVRSRQRQRAGTVIDGSCQDRAVPGGGVRRGGFRGRLRSSGNVCHPLHEYGAEAGNEDQPHCHISDVPAFHCRSLWQAPRSAAGQFFTQRPSSFLWELCFTADQATLWAVSSRLASPRRSSLSLYSSKAELYASL